MWQWMRDFMSKGLYTPTRDFYAGPVLDNRLLAGRSVYNRPPQTQFCKAGWHELIPSPVEGGFLADWKHGYPLLTQVGGADRNRMLADIYMKEIM